MIFGKKKSKRKFTRIFYATDVHGSEVTFRKFVSAGKIYKPDVLILGGDVTGKIIVPIVEQRDGTYQCAFLGNELKLKTKADVEAIEKKINRVGYYPYYTDVAGMEELGNHPEKVDEIFKKLMKERLTKWVRFAEEKLKNTGIKCFMTGGNDDLLEVEDILDSSDFILNPEGRVVYVDKNHEMIGSGYANITPWKCPRDIPDEELAEKIEAVISKVENMETSIFCFHTPPVDCKIDRCPKVDASVNPPKMIKDASGQPVYFGAGSRAVRNAIEKYQPLLGLHGHIHEARGIVKVGRTVCVNPGSEYGEGILNGVIINLKGEKILSYQLTSG